MSPVRHPISGTALSFQLEDEIRIVREELGASHSRIGRTIIKEGPLRVTLVGLGAGAELQRHRAEGPITVQVLDGEIEFEAEGKSWPMHAGTLLALEGGIEHAARAAQGGIFLLTVVASGNGNGGGAPAH